MEIFFKMTINALIKAEQKISKKNYDYVFGVVSDLIKSDKKKIKFFEHLNAYIEAEIELDKLCAERDN